MASIFTDSWENIGMSLEAPGPADSNTFEPTHEEEQTDTTVNSSTDAFNSSNEMDQIPVMPIGKTAALSFTLMGAAFLNTLSVQAMVIAMPSIGRDLKIPENRYQWIITSYSLTFGCFLLFWGKICDIYGKRLVFLLGGIWVALSSLGTAFCPTEISFVILRALAGLGAAANVPAAIGILGTSIPPGRVKSYAFAIYSAGAPLGAVCGILVGGWMTQYVSWKSIFYLVSAVCMAVTIIAFFIIPIPPPKEKGLPKVTVDWIGAFLITSCFVLLVVALSQGNSEPLGWKTPYIIALLVICVLLFVAFVYWQQWLEKNTNREPLMRLSIWKHRGFTMSMIVNGFFWASFNNYMIYSTFFYQDYLSLSPIATTLRFIPTGVAGALITIISGYILSRISGQWILLVGIFCTSLASLLMAIPISPTTTYWAYGFPAMVLAVMGADTVYPCLSLYTTSRMPMKDQALAGGIFNTVGQLGRAIGLALVTAVDVSVRRSGGNSLGGPKPEMKDHNGMDMWVMLGALRTTQWVNCGFAVIAWIFVLAGLRRIGKVGAEKVVMEKSTA